jgi:hypothetical protein
MNINITTYLLGRDESLWKRSGCSWDESQDLSMLGLGRPDDERLRLGLAVWSKSLSVSSLYDRYLPMRVGIGT